MFNSIKNFFSGGDKDDQGKKRPNNQQNKVQKPKKQKMQTQANDDDDEDDDYGQQAQMQMPMQQQYMQQQYLPGPYLGSSTAAVKLSPELEEWRMSEDKIIPAGPKDPTKTESVVLPPLSECIQVGVTFEYGKLLASKDPKKMPVMVSINETKINDLEQDTCKADIICVIDVSGSMAGGKLENVKTTMKLLLELLDGSRIAIVTFGTSAQLYMNFKTVNSDNTTKITSIINSLRDLDSTNITGGVHEAQNLLGRRLTKNPVSSLFLLSDGQHNIGPISNELMFDNDYDRTKAEYTVHSFGYGDDHDAKLMQSMSERKGGNYYFVQDIKRVDECFVDCLGMVTTMLANRGKMAIRLQPTAAFPEIRLLSTYGPYLSKASDIEATLSVPTLYAGMKKDYLFELEFDAAKRVPEAAQQLDVIELDFEFYEVGKPQPTKVTKIVSVTLLPPSSTQTVYRDLEVLKNYFRVKTGEIINQADAFKRSGNYQEALKLLQVFEAEIDKDLDLQNDLLVISLKTQIKQIKTMIDNDARGIQNECKTENYVAQQKNIFMNQCSAPMFEKEGFYENKKAKSNMAFLKSKKG